MGKRRTCLSRIDLFEVADGELMHVFDEILSPSDEIQESPEKRIRVMNQCTFLRGTVYSGMLSRDTTHFNFPLT